MKKYFLNLLLVMLIIFFFGSNILTTEAFGEVSEKIEKEITFNGSLGAVMLYDKDGEKRMYYEFSLNPEIAFWKLGMGLSLFMHWNDAGLRKEDYDKSNDIANIIRYIRYDEKGAHPVYFRIGKLDEATLGHGFILGDYRNELKNEFSKRVLGCELDLNLEKMGLETIANDIANPRVFGGRVYIYPFKIINVTMPLLNKLTLGITYCADKNPDPDNTGENSLVVYGLDASLPIIKNILIIYGDIAEIKDNGNGSAIGVMGNRKAGLMPIFLGYKFEYRAIEKNFSPGTFDALYEMIRPPQLSNEDLKGYYGELSMSMLETIEFTMGYEDYEKNEPTISGKLSIDDKWTQKILKKKISASATYYQTNAKDVFSITNPNTLITYEIKYGISENITMVYTTKQTYKIDNKTPIRNTSLFTYISF
ncbi:MAG: hypothetical protein QMD92_02825 [bacterium]|nr:hypothetical protein [bacterium]